MDNRGTGGQMTESSLAQKTSCSSKEKRNAGFRCFQGPLSRGSETVASYVLNIDLVIIPGGMTSQLQVVDVIVNKPFKD
jgi:hypothetical protein